MLVQDLNNVWLSRKMYECAEIKYYEDLAKVALTPLAGEVAKARQQLIKSRDSFKSDVESVDIGAIKFFEKKVVEFEKSIDLVLKQIKSLDDRVLSLEKLINQAKPIDQNNIPASASKVENDDVDLFGSDSDEDDEAAAKVKEERLKAYNAKKSKKPALIAKSSVILDVKPWDDETDMKEMEKNVRKIEAVGLLWGASKLVLLAYGIKKLQISCVVEDDKVSIDWLTEELEKMKDYVQSVDIAAFNKI